MSNNAEVFGSYLTRVAEALKLTETDELRGIARKIIEAKKSGARIFTAGNGGSASTASHFVNDLIKGCRVGDNAGFAAQCLCDSVPVLTCLANDFDYGEVFKIQLETLAKEGDLLFLFSGSGNSPNIIRAAEYAAENKIFVAGFGGRDGGALKNLCDGFVLAPSHCMEEIEDLHLCYCHCIINFIRGELEQNE